MKQLNSKKHCPSMGNNAVISHGEIETVFGSECDYLYWIALVITGESATSEELIRNTSLLLTSGVGVFRDRLVGRVRSVIARTAVRTVHRIISSSASSHATASCNHLEHKVLSDEEIRSLYQVNPREVTTELDPLSRSVLVLRGMQRASISDCTLLLAVPRRYIINAYSAATQWWNCKREHALKTALNGRLPTGILNAPAHAHDRSCIQRYN